MSKLRCAIYTRKSSDEGLEQEFNSLDAQHEACRSFIASQRHEGWTLLRDRYDDGGFSGGSMERPGLKKLLADIEAGKVDVVVIYKIDRLTRSLADFARMMELFEQADVSFVSVTQSFNTKTSMGRLMLHVLLSFAQFEREVGAERVRDKIAASKAKGMWMGGTVPLGYDVADRKLAVNEAEAETVRAILTKFTELKSVPASVAWANDQGLRTKVMVRKGKQCGGKAFGYGALRRLLSNRLYAGEVVHKSKIYEGQHDAIVDRGLFERVQEILSAKCSDNARGPKLRSNSLLQGILTDCHGRTMGPVHTVRRGQRYSYYATHPKTISENDPAALRIPADKLEQSACAILIEHWQSGVASIEDRDRVNVWKTIVLGGDASSKRALIVEQIESVEVGEGMLRLKLKDGAALEQPMFKLRHGNDAQLIVGEQISADAGDPQMVKLMHDALMARKLAISKPMTSLPKLAAQFGRSTERFKRLLRLSYLSPKIIEAALSNEGLQIIARDLQNLNGLPLAWSEQQNLLLG